MNSNENSRRNRRGFTLIELLVVVVIIGILAAIATPIYLNYRRAAWRAAAVSDATNAVLAVETARTKTGTLDGMTFTPGTSPSPMVVAVGTETVKAPTSPDDTLTAWTGTQTDGSSCYAVMATNSNLPGWAAVRTDSKLTTGEPPANGSTECPRPTAKMTAHIKLNTGSGGMFDFKISLVGQTATVKPIDAGSPANATMAAVAPLGDGDPSLVIVSVAGSPLKNGVSWPEWTSPAPLLLGLQNGGTITIDTTTWTASYSA